MTSRRLFAGIALPEEKLTPLIQAVSKLKRTAEERDFKMKWLEKLNWHVTLWFFGHVDKEKEEKIRAMLKTVSRQQKQLLELDIKGLGAFPQPMQGRVFWAGVSRTKELVDLYDRGVSELAKDQISASEHELFTPHVTLARFRHPQSATPLIEPFARKGFFSFAAKEIVLYESHLQNFYPKYERLEGFSII